MDTSKLKFFAQQARKLIKEGVKFELQKKGFNSDGSVAFEPTKISGGTLFDGEIYDVNGKREDYFNFHEATGADLEYIYKYYGFFSDWVKESLNNMIRNNVYKEKNKVKVLVKIN